MNVETPIEDILATVLLRIHLSTPSTRLDSKVPFFKSPAWPGQEPNEFYQFGGACSPTN